MDVQYYGGLEPPDHERGPLGAGSDPRELAGHSKLQRRCDFCKVNWDLKKSCFNSTKPKKKELESMRIVTLWGEGRSSGDQGWVLQDASRTPAS